MATAEQDDGNLPRQLLADLKSEVEALKKKLTPPDAKANELILEIESLKDSIHELNTIFQKALEQTKEEDLAKVIKIISQKLDTVATQNETIAKGMIAISDKLEEFMANQGQMSATAPRGGMAQPIQHILGAPQMPGSRMAPPLQMEPSPFPESEYPSPIRTDAPPPPPPPGAAGKKKLIGAIFK